jgi:hypothetical protein
MVRLVGCNLDRPPLHLGGSELRNVVQDDLAEDANGCIGPSMSAYSGATPVASRMRTIFHDLAWRYTSF